MGFGRALECFEGVCSQVVQQKQQYSIGGGEEVFIPFPQKLAVIVLVDFYQSIRTHPETPASTGTRAQNAVRN